MTQTQDSQQKARAFRDEVLAKIDKTVRDFSDGRLSSEQFQAIYARYTEQLTIANMAMMSGESDGIDVARGDGTQTIALRSTLQGKALGLIIYHNRSGVVVEMLGNPTVPIQTVGALLNDFSGRMELGETIEPLIKKLEDKKWLVLAAGQYTSLMTQFRHEPSQRQIKEMERLHDDFERANRASLAGSNPGQSKLAIPFLTFVERRIK
ncbi:MAG: hypothetical protein EA396_08300 [Anaerolineaceae bacterium]|nr:MAG: hypothetical protein EA396_08300 [Anaerolineaceae bacterium]